MARRESAHLEQRNAQSLADTRVEADKLLKKSDVEAKQLRAVVYAEVAKLTEVKSNLQDEISGLNIAKEKINSEVANFKVRREDVEAQVLSNAEKLAELDEQLIQATEDLMDRRGKIEVLRQEVHELELAKEHSAQDLEILNAAVDETEERIMELDSGYKTRRETLEAQVSEIQRKLNDALANLVDAQNKDKQIRENWADEHRKLDKRTQTVRRMEAKLSDAEARVAELDNYMKL